MSRKQSQLQRKGSSFAGSLRRNSSKKDLFTTVNDGLRQHYLRTLKPFEETHLFHSLHGPPLEEAEFTSRPSVMLVGQYSTGKTTLIRYLLGENFEGCRIGPEPTTDKFHIVMGRDEDEDDDIPTTIPGNALVVDPRLPYRPLAKFGNSFLNRFHCTKQKNKFLSEITLIDTPGILSGEKQTTDRGYDFVEVLEWFAGRVDLVLLLFDANKLDISDEQRRVIQALSRWDEKIRIILNKADGIDNQQLMRVYGALMWSLGKVLTCPEVPRVFIGSWWDKQLRHVEMRSLFEKEEQDLFRDFRTMPRGAALRKLNDMIKRARLARVLALIVDELHVNMPLLRKEAAKKNLLKNLEETIKTVEFKHGTCTGDLPPIEKLRENLSRADWSKFRQVDKRQLAKLDRLLTEEMARLISMLPAEMSAVGQAILNGPIEASKELTPFNQSQGLNSHRWTLGVSDQWIVSNDSTKMARWTSLFMSGGPVNGKLTGNKAKPLLLDSQLPNSVLSKVWSLADADMDGMLSLDEFCLAMYLIDHKLAGNDLPDYLPSHLVPDSSIQNEQVVPHMGSDKGSFSQIPEETSMDME